MCSHTRAHRATYVRYACVRKGTVSQSRLLPSRPQPSKSAKIRTFHLICCFFSNVTVLIVRRFFCYREKENSKFLICCFLLKSATEKRIPPTLTNGATVGASTPRKMCYSWTSPSHPSPRENMLQCDPTGGILL